MIFAIVIGLLLPTAIGWLTLRILEWKSPVLSRMERIILGFPVGCIESMYLVFLVHILGGIKLNLIGFLVVREGKKYGYL